MGDDESNAQAESQGKKIGRDRIFFLEEFSSPCPALLRKDLRNK
jgi:hypothetical protein